MATAQTQITVTLTAGEDLDKYKAVALVGGDAEYVSSSKNPAVGLCTDGAKNGEPVSVQVHGIGKGIANAAITKGQYVYAHTNGNLVGDNDVDQSEFDTPLGYALEAATAQGNIISVLLVQTNPTTA